MKIKILLFFLTFSPIVFSMEKEGVKKIEEELTSTENLSAEAQHELILYLFSKFQASEDIYKVAKTLKDFLQKNVKFVTLIDNNIEYVIDQLAQKFNVPKAYAAALLDTPGALEWLKKQIDLGGPSDVQKIIEYSKENSKNYIERFVIMQAFVKIYPFFAEYVKTQLKS